jgi:hypothetical protein
MPQFFFALSSATDPADSDGTGFRPEKQDKELRERNLALQIKDSKEAVERSQKLLRRIDHLLAKEGRKP